jgi:hypothetical protein
MICAFRIIFLSTNSHEKSSQKSRMILAGLWVGIPVVAGGLVTAKNPVPAPLDCYQTPLRLRGNLQETYLQPDARPFRAGLSPHPETGADNCGFGGE